MTRKWIKTIIIQAIVFGLILLSLSMMWSVNNFGNIGLNEIAFTLNMPLKGTANSYFQTYFLYAFCPSIVLFGLELFARFHKAKRKYSIKASFKD